MRCIFHPLQLTRDKSNRTTGNGRIIDVKNYVFYKLKVAFSSLEYTDDFYLGIHTKTKDDDLTKIEIVLAFFQRERQNH